MDKFNKSHILVLSLLAALLLMTPLLSSNLRPTYLYFMTNILILVLGAEAGLFSVSSSSSDGKRNAKNNIVGTKNPALWQQPLPAMTSDGNRSTHMAEDEGADPALSSDAVTLIKTENIANRVKVVEKCVSEKVSVINVGVKKKENEFKRCPSMPSLFFIGGSPEAKTDDGYQEADFGQDQEDEPVDEGMISGQELFMKAETFIGNFYQQLRMQREESWKRIHGLYQKAF